MTDTNQLIERLARSAKPVRLLASPLRRAARWVGAVIAVIATLVVVMGPRPGLVEAMSVPAAAMEWAAAVLTGLLAGYAVFEVSVPGGSTRWAWLPTPALALWLGSIGLGCLGDWMRVGANAFDFDSHGAMCLAMIVMIGVPLALAMLLMVRHAAAARPVETAILASLSTAAFAAAGVSLVHPGDTALMVLLWHVGAVLMLMVMAAVFGRRALAWIGYERAAADT